MHELAVAQSLAEFVCDQITDMDTTRERVKTVKIRVGAMANIQPLALKSAFRAAVAGTALQSSGLEVETVDLVVWCPQCHQERLLRSITTLRCPVCNIRITQIMQGKELEIESIEVVDATQDTGSPPAHT